MADRICKRCGGTYFGKGKCTTPNCYKDHRASASSASGTADASWSTGTGGSSGSRHQDEWQQHDDWQHWSWQQDEYMSSKQKRKLWWQQAKAYKKRKQHTGSTATSSKDYASTGGDSETASSSRNHPKSPPPVPPPPFPPPVPEHTAAPKQAATQKAAAASSKAAPTKTSRLSPEQKSMPKPKPSSARSSSQAKPQAKPRGSAGQAPPWRGGYISSDSESSGSSFPRVVRPRIIETPGPVIEEILPELEWYPMDMNMICDGEAPAAEDQPSGQAAPQSTPAFAEDEGEESEQDDDVEMDLASEDAARVASAALKEMKQAQKIWNATGEVIPYEVEEPDVEPLAHIAAFNDEPNAEPSPVAVPEVHYS
jgi:hypothetical protein